MALRTQTFAFPVTWAPPANTSDPANTSIEADWPSAGHAMTEVLDRRVGAPFMDEGLTFTEGGLYVVRADIITRVVIAAGAARAAVLVRSMELDPFTGGGGSG